MVVMKSAGNPKGLDQSHPWEVERVRWDSWGDCTALACEITSGL